MDPSLGRLVRKCVVVNICGTVDRERCYVGIVMFQEIVEGDPCGSRQCRLTSVKDWDSYHSCTRRSGL